MTSQPLATMPADTTSPSGMELAPVVANPVGGNAVVVGSTCSPAASISTSAGSAAWNACGCAARSVPHMQLR
jgi:hypothetical protein